MGRSASGPTAHVERVERIVENRIESLRGHLDDRHDSFREGVSRFVREQLTNAYMAGLSDGWNQGLDHAARSIAAGEGTPS